MQATRRIAMLISSLACDHGPSTIAKLIWVWAGGVPPLRISLPPSRSQRGPSRCVNWHCRRPHAHRHMKLLCSSKSSQGAPWQLHGCKPGHRISRPSCACNCLHTSHLPARRAHGAAAGADTADASSLTDCSFIDKVEAAKLTGAAAVIILNERDDQGLTMDTNNDNLSLACATATPRSCVLVLFSAL